MYHIYGTFLCLGENEKIAIEKCNFLPKKVMGKITNEYLHFFSPSQKKRENLTDSVNPSYNESSREARKFGKRRDEKRKTKWKNILF